MGGVDVPFVGGDHVPAGLLEPAREAARAGEQVDPDRLRLRELDRRRGRRVGEVGPVGDEDAAVGALPAVAGADRAGGSERHQRLPSEDVSLVAAEASGTGPSTGTGVYSPSQNACASRGLSSVSAR